MTFDKGKPIGEFIREGKQENAKRQLENVTRIFNDAVKTAKAEGLIVMITLNAKEYQLDSEEPIKVEVQNNDNV